MISKFRRKLMLLIAPLSHLKKHWSIVILIAVVLPGACTVNIEHHNYNASNTFGEERDELDARDSSEAADSDLSVESIRAAGLSTSKFAAMDGRVLVFAGQTLEATDAYYRSKVIPNPAGFTDYISYDVGADFHPKALDAPSIYLGNDGLLQAVNWGAGSQCVDCNLVNPEFDNAMIAIGMYIAGPRLEDGSMCSGDSICNTARLARGEFDEQLQILADWFIRQEDRPIFLRIGYEFDGSWNNYAPEDYIKAYKYIVRFMDQADITNVAYIWQTAGYASKEQLDKFFPKPDAYRSHYVDWVGYSYFSYHADRVGINELAFAREHGLNAFISEVAPHTSDCKNQIDVSENTELAKRWIDSLFAHIEKNIDVVKGFSYINARWNDAILAPQWIDQNDHHCGGFFSRSNSRLQDNPEVEAYWSDQIKSVRFMNEAPENWQQILSDTYLSAPGADYPVLNRKRGD